MSRKDWTAPAPLEVERPRLPWWVMIPRKALLWVAPLIAGYLLARLVEHTARRLWRYPVLLGGVAVLGWLVLTAFLALRDPAADDHTAASTLPGTPLPAVDPEASGLPGVWWWTAAAVFVIAVGAGLWWWRWPDSFARYAACQVRSEFRRGWVYARVWRRTVTFADLGRRIGRTRYFPTIRWVRAEGWRDRVSVKLLHGQAPSEFAKRSDQLAHSFGAMSCRVRVDRPRRIWLDFLHRDPLVAPLVAPALAEPGTVVDPRRVVVGQLETGRAWTLRLAGRHVLVVGSTDAGKSSVVWSALWHLAPAIRAGLVQVFGIDPKGGMELGRARPLFTRLVCSNGADAVELLEHVATLTRQRAERFAGDRVAEWTPATGAPFVLLIVDELADVVAYQTDSKLRARANAALATMTSQGRAPGVCVLGEVQDPRKSVLDFRHLFPVRVAMRLDEADQVDLVLGDGARERGAACDEISEDTPGVAWVKTDGRREVDRGRAFHITTGDLDALCSYVAAGNPPRALTREAA